MYLKLLYFMFMEEASLAWAPLYIKFIQELGLMIWKSHLYLSIMEKRRSIPTLKDCMTVFKHIFGP